MSAPGERQSARRLAANGIGVGLLALAALPVYLVLEPSWRPLLLRLGCAAAVAVVCTRVARGVRSAIDEDPPSPLDAPRPMPTPPALDPRFLRLCDHLTLSIRSRRYFFAVLWPRLVTLARSPLLEPSPRRWFSRLGPSRAVLESLIAQIERRT